MTECKVTECKVTECKVTECKVTECKVTECKVPGCNAPEKRVDASQVCDAVRFPNITSSTSPSAAPVPITLCEWEKLLSTETDKNLSVSYLVC